MMRVEMKAKSVGKTIGKKRLCFFMLVSPFCLQSCIHIGVQRNINPDPQKKTVCSSSSKSENARCKENMKILNESIEKHSL